MGQFFARDYTGAPFELFGPAHLAFLAFLVFAYILLYAFRDKFSDRQKIFLRWFLAVWMVANELAYHAWHIYYGIWSIRYQLPLHICSIMVFAGAFMLVTRNATIYEFSYFMGIGAAMQALLTPDAGIYGFPHFRFFQTLIAHGLIIFSALYMTWVEKFRPYPKSLLRVFIGMNIYMAVIFVFNPLIGSNYLFIAHKPETASLIDLLGPWPWYILSLEAIGVAVCLLLYLPFFLKDLAAKRAKVPSV
jgi:hypothetical integral membrane protein (TIGR02206 family)